MIIACSDLTFCPEFKSDSLAQTDHGRDATVGLTWKTCVVTAGLGPRPLPDFISAMNINEKALYHYYGTSGRRAEDL